MPLSTWVSILDHHQNYTVSPEALSSCSFQNLSTVDSEVCRHHSKEGSTVDGETGVQTLPSHWERQDSTGCSETDVQTLTFPPRQRAPQQVDRQMYRHLPSTKTEGPTACRQTDVQTLTFPPRQRAPQQVDRQMYRHLPSTKREGPAASRQTGVHTLTFQPRESAARPCSK